MEKQRIVQTLEKAKTDSKERKFTQTIDLIINLRGINIKKSDEQVNLFVELPHETGKKAKICGLVSKDLGEQAKKEFDFVIEDTQFEEYITKKKEFKKIAGSHDFFVAQANIMPKVAKSFGAILGKKGKIPNPKAGCVVPPNADLAKVKTRLQKMVKAQAKTEVSIKCAVGNEKMDPAQVVENVLAVYNKVKGALPQEEQNIKSVMLKLTMGPAVKVAK